MPPHQDDVKFVDIWPVLCMLVLATLFVGNALVVLEAQDSCYFNESVLPAVYIRRYGAGLDLRLAWALGFQGFYGRHTAKEASGVTIVFLVICVIGVIAKQMYNICIPGRAIDVLWQDSITVSVRQCNLFSMHPPLPCELEPTWVIASVAVAWLHAMHHLAFAQLLLHQHTRKGLCACVFGAVATWCAYKYPTKSCDECALLDHYLAMCRACACNFLTCFAAYAYTHKWHQAVWKEVFPPP
jgi:hypothetical protein